MCPGLSRPSELAYGTYGEDACQIRTGSGPQVMVTLRNFTIAILKPGGPSNIAVATRRHARDATRIPANPSD